MKNILRQMQKLNKATLAASEAAGKSVCYVRRAVVDEAVAALEKHPDEELCLFGVKDTQQIDPRAVKRLQQLPAKLFHTLDAMSPMGRAIDTGLINPLTGRVMTGSSSGSCINILLGINDLALATDGGGSVLGPAISCGLYSIMGKGLGLEGISQRDSTDGIQFVPGLGAISHSLRLCQQAIFALADLKESQRLPRELIVPQSGLSHQNQALVDDVVARLDIPVRTVDLPQRYDRLQLIDFLNSVLEGDVALLTAEGPIDYHGLGDSVLGSFGETGARVQEQSGKQLLKVANMVNATAISLPTVELATGLVIIAPQGQQPGAAAIALAQQLDRLLPEQPLHRRYLSQRWQDDSKGFF